MSDRRYSSDEIKAGRVVQHGKIASLASGFKMRNGTPFSLFLIHKTDDSIETVKVSLKLYEDTAASECPMRTKQWNELLVLEIPVNAISLTDYDVYWGTPDFDQATTL